MKIRRFQYSEFMVFKSLVKYGISRKSAYEEAEFLFEPYSVFTGESINYK